MADNTSYQIVEENLSLLDFRHKNHKIKPSISIMFLRIQRGFYIDFPMCIFLVIINPDIVNYYIFTVNSYSYMVIIKIIQFEKVKSIKT